MEHLINKNTFHNNQYQRVDEVFRNEVTWGGSLLGRLFNSTYRKIEIEINTASMNNVVQEIRRVMEQILVQSLDRDDRINFYKLRLKYLVNKIKEECYYAQEKRPDWVEETDCEGSNGKQSKLQNLIGINTRDAKPTFRTRLPNFDSEDQNPVINKYVGGVMTEVGTFTERPLEPEPDSYLNQLNTLLDQFENNDSYRDLFTLDELDNLRRVHDTFIVELRRFRIFRCLGVPYNKNILKESNPSQWFNDNTILSGVFQNLRNSLQENVKFTKVTNPLFSRDDEWEKTQYNKNYSSSSGGAKDFSKILKFDHFISYINEEKTPDCYEDLDKLNDTELWRAIAKSTHPDSNKENPRPDLFIKAEDFKKNKNRKGLIEIAKDLGLECSPPSSGTSGLVNIKTHIPVKSSTTTSTGIVTATSSTATGGTTTSTSSTATGGTSTTPTTTSPPSTTTGGTTTTPTSTSPPSTTTGGTTTTSTTTSPPSTGDCDIKCIWDHFFLKGDDIKPYLFTSGDDRSLRKLENKMTSGQLDLNYNPDPVTGKNDLFIYFVRLLRKAFDLFATQGIKSGRPGGIVSPSVYREYIKMGTGKDATGRGTSGGGADAGGNYVKPDIDTYYANKRIYNVFADGIADIIGDQKFRKIFANINFQFQGTEDKFNVQRENYSGKTLMKFGQFSICESEKKGSTSGEKDIYTGKGEGGKEMGRAIIDLLSTLAFDIKSVNDFEGLIRKNVVRYFTGSNLEKQITQAASEGSGNKPRNTGKDDSGKDDKDKNLNWIKYDQKDTDEIPKKKYLCWSAKINKNNLPDFEDGILNSSENNLIFINRNPGPPVYFKKKNGVGVEKYFIPVKLTFDNPVGAIFVAGGKDKITPNLQRVPKDQVYSGYIVRGKDFWHLFYIGVSDNKVKYNSFKIETYTYDIDSKLQEVNTLELSKDYNPGAAIHGSEDYSRWEDPYNVSLASGETFTDFMKEHFKDPNNVDKLD